MEQYDEDYFVSLERRARTLKDHEYYETVDDVFDHATVKALIDLFNRRIISVMYGAVAQGKEAKVFRGRDPAGNEYAVKIFYTSTARFIRGRYVYMVGDPRFPNVKRNMRKLVEAWCLKEYGNLKRAYDAAVSVPRPIHAYRNILVMEFIGDLGEPAPLLRDEYPDDPEQIYLEVLRNVERSVVLGRIIHGDLSEYNVMLWGGRTILIDWGSGVRLGHPKDADLLIRDVRNITRFFVRALDYRRVFEPERVAEAILKRTRKKTSERDGWIVVEGKTLLDELS